MNLSKQDKYSIIYGKFYCQNCETEINTSRFYAEKLDITWKCKECEHVSNVNIFKERGY